MKKARILALALSVMLVLALLAGCGGAASSSAAAPAASSAAASEPAASEAGGDSAAEPAAASGEKYKIGFTVFGMDDKFTTYIVDGATQFAEEHPDEVDLQIGDSKQDSATQLSLVENWCSQDYDAIIIYVVDSTMGPTLINVCNEAGVPIIGCNRAFDGMEEGIVAYVGSDETQAGTVQAEYIAEQLGGEGNVAILMGTLGLDNTAKRTDGNKAVFEQYEGITVVEEQTADWDRAEAMKVVENWLQMDLDLKAIVCNNDEMAIGAANALEAEGIKDQVLVSGIDATPDALEAMKEGKLDASTFQPGIMQGYTAVETALATCKGEGPASYEAIWLDFELVTPDKADEYLAMY